LNFLPVPDARHGQEEAHRAVADATLNVVTLGRPLLVPPLVPVVAGGLEGNEVARLTHAAVRADGVLASYFVFHPEHAYTLDIGPLGMVLDAVVRARVELQKRGQAPYGGQVQYGRLHRRLHIHRPRPKHLRTTFFTRGDDQEFPKEGCWSGDFSPGHSYTAYIHHLGMLVLSNLGPADVSSAEVPDPRFGELLGILSVRPPRGGRRSATYLCY